MGKMKETLREDESIIDIQPDEDYLYEQYLTQEKLNEEYWEQKAKETVDIINANYDNRFCFYDVIAAVMEVTNDERLANEIGNKLNELYVRRMTFEVQINS